MAYPMPNKMSSPSEPAAAPLSRKGPKTPWLKGLVTLVVVLIIIGGGLYLIGTYTGLGSGLVSSTHGLVKAEWQAVFLTNGQVYFGQVTRIDDDFLVLKDIYYLQVVTLKNSNAIAQPSDVQNQPEQQLTLIKLGNEIHGPADEMTINRDHVVLLEDLKNDSRVVTAITDYQKKQETAPAKPAAE